MGSTGVSDINENKENTNDELMMRAMELIQFSKNKMKILYQLMFIATSDAPERDMAENMISKMLKRNMFTIEQVEKAREDVKRWRRMFLDRITQE
jgi:pantothenate kinase type III